MANQAGCSAPNGLSRERLEQMLAAERASLASWEARDKAMRPSGTRSAYTDDQHSRVHLLLELLAEIDAVPSSGERGNG